MSYKATAELKLKRFLYLSSEESSFITGNPEIHNKYQPDKLTCASDLLKDDLSKNKSFLTNLFVAAENEPLLSRREALFFALARFATHEEANDEQRHSFYTLVLNMCNDNVDLFNFIKFMSKIKKPLCSGVQKIIAAYYFRQDPMDLIKSICESNSYHGWTHRDLIKLVHFKTDNPVIEVIIKYIIYGEAKAIEAAADNPDASNVIEYIKKVKEFRTCKDENKAAQYIPELNIKRIDKIPSSLSKSQTVWAAVIQQLSLNDLITCLPKLYKKGFLKPGIIHTKVIDILSNNDIIQSSHIHPVEVYIGLKNLEKGGRPKDPQLIKYLETKEDIDAKIAADPEYKKPNFAHQEPARCTGVMAALQKALVASYVNLRPVCKRIMVTIDVNDRMNEECLTTKNVTCIEAAGIIALCLLKANKAVTIAAFNGNTVTPLSVDKNVTLPQLMKKLTEAKHGVPMWSAPFDWAVNGCKPFDVFLHMGLRLNFLDLVKEDREKDKPREAFSNYMKKMNLPLTKLITHHLGMHNAYFSGGDTNILDICGFDKNVPNIIDGYCNNLF